MPCGIGGARPIEVDRIAECARDRRVQARELLLDRRADARARTSSRNSSSIARIRRITWIDDEPYSRISVMPSDQVVLPAPERGSPGPVRVTSDVLVQLERAKGRSCRSAAERHRDGSSTCTAVVGSLTAGDSALSAMSTMIRIANAGSCSIVRSDAEHDHPAELALGPTARRRRRHRPRSTQRRAGTKSPIAWRNSDEAVVLARPRRASPFDVDRLNRPRRGAAHHQRRLFAAGLEHPAEDVRRGRQAPGVCV